MRKLILVILLLGLKAGVMAQYIDYAKYLIDQGQYLEAAKELRPLADGGNAEAQYLAATLFFSGRGVTKSDSQGIRYATLSANQAYEPAVNLLQAYYASKGDEVKSFQILDNYIAKYPSLLNSDVGAEFGKKYYYGLGTSKDIVEAWKILEHSETGRRFKKEHEEEYNEVMPGRISNFRITKVNAVVDDKLLEVFSTTDKEIRVSFSFNSTKVHNRTFGAVIKSASRQEEGRSTFTSSCYKGGNSWWMNVNCSSLSEGKNIVSVYNEGHHLGSFDFYVHNSAQASGIRSTQSQQSQLQTSCSVPNIKLGFCFAEAAGSDLKISITITSLLNSNNIRLNSVLYPKDGKMTSSHTSLGHSRYQLLNRDEKMIFVTTIKNIAFKKKLDKVVISMASNNKQGYITLQNLTW